MGGDLGQCLLLPRMHFLCSIRRILYGDDWQEVDDDSSGFPICFRNFADNVCRICFHALYWSSSLWFLVRSFWPVSSLLHLGDRRAEHQGSSGVSPAAHCNAGGPLCRSSRQIRGLSSDDWNIPLHPLLMTVWMFFMPESPVFLVSKGRMEAARSSLLFLRGPKYDVDKELLEIQSSVRESQEAGSIGLVSLLTQSHYTLPLLLSVMLMFLQQFSGVNAVLAFAVQLFEDTGVTDTIDAYTCNILVCLTQFL